MLGNFFGCVHCLQAVCLKSYGRTRSGQQMRPLRLKPGLILNFSRGAKKVPLFHVTARICEFFARITGCAIAKTYRVTNSVV